MSDKIIILIPGAFNPPTIAHMKIGETLRKNYPWSEIWYLPAMDKYITGWKNQVNPIPFGDRTTLISYNLPRPSNVTNIFVNTAEQDVGTGKTFDVLSRLKNNFKGTDFVICLGEDKLKELPRWYKYEELVSENRFIIMTRDKSRDTFPLELLPYADNFEFLDFDYSDISSTKIREAHLSGQLDTVREFIPRNVYEYLQTHNDLFKEADTNV